MLPDFIIIGAMKGGTTALYYYMASHPDIEPSSFKEINYFTKNYSKGIDWYKSLFKTERKYAFEASPNYTKLHKFPNTPERIHSLLPKVKLIYLLRDPIDRIVSQYNHNYAQGRESLSLSEVIRNKNSKYNRTRKNLYIKPSKYNFQIEGYMKYFDRSQLLLVESELLRDNPQKILTEIAEFLDISPDFKVQTLEKQFNQFQPKDPGRVTQTEPSLSLVWPG